MKKWILSSAAVLMLIPTTTFAEGPIPTSKTTNLASAVTTSAITSWSQFVDEIAQGLNNFETTIKVKYSGPMNGDFTENAIESYDLAKEKAVYGAEHISSVAYQLSSDGTATYEVTYLTNKTQEAKVQEKIDQVLATIIKPSMNDFQKVKAVNDYIVSHTKYGENTKSSPHSAYALLFEGQAVCQGYALLGYKMLDQLGFEVKYVVGKVNKTELHSWNLVKLSGKWYHLDPTWNDPVPNRLGTFSYDYFLVSDTQLAKDHEWIKSDYPSATSTTYQYMLNIRFGYEINNTMYFSNKADKDKLYKMDLLKGTKTRVLDTRVQYVTGAGDYLYYSDYNNGGFLMKMTIRTSKAEVMAKVHAEDLYVDGRNLVYRVGNKEHKVKIDVPEVTPPPKPPAETIKVPAAISSFTAMEARESKDPKKSWRIQLSTALDASSISSNNVYVLDAAGKKVTHVTAKLENERYITLQNNGAYSKNVYYFVVVEKSVKSTKGKNLPKSMYIPFKIK
ncbi:MAG: DUF5050 domain-containing protein [Lysinibacillus sp.]